MANLLQKITGGLKAEKPIKLYGHGGVSPPKSTLNTKRCRN